MTDFLITYIVPGIRCGLWLAEGLTGLPILYVCIISTAALLASRRHQRVPGGKPGHVQNHDLPTFAVIVPAHNEAILLGRLLESLARLRYPKERYSVYVVADNCQDGTAALARTYERVRVYERVDQERRGKGYALRWLLDQLQADGLNADAYLFIDADSIVVPEFLTAMAEGLSHGAEALQGQHTVLNTTTSPSTVLRWITLTLVNHLRPLGRTAINGSSTITGNGFCLRRSLLERHPWQSYTLAEDREYYLSLVRNGERISYVPDAVVRAEMPPTFAQMRTQDIRWEARETFITRCRTATALLRDGIAHRDFVRLEALAELLTPPLAVLVAVTGLLLILALLLGAPLQIWLALALVGGVLIYIGTGLFLMQLPRAAYPALLYAPGFMLWKLWVHFVLSRSKKHTRAWVRTSRPDSMSC